MLPRSSVRYSITFVEICVKVALKFLRAHKFHILRWIKLISGMMIDTGPKFLSAISRSRSHTYFHVEILTWKFFKSSILLFNLMIDLITF